LYDDHITPIADTFAWVLMKNHFHLLVRIKNPVGLHLNPQGFQNLEGLGNKLHQPFSNLFNAYTKAFNKQYQRTGSLFEHPFRRKLIPDIEYFKRVVIYIHNNPVHHGITEYAMDYPWSSYLTCISIKPTHLRRDEVIGWFNNEADFKTAHDNRGDGEELEKWLGL
jgi:REP element-mobilizing transposase RayT